MDPRQTLRRSFTQSQALVLVLLTLTAAASSGQTGSKSQTVERIDPRFEELVPPGAALEQVAGGFQWVEGPLWSRTDQRLLFSDIPANAIWSWKEGDAAQIFQHPSGYTGAQPFTGREPGSNGLAADRSGRLVICEHGDRRITRLEADGTKTVLVDRFRGKRLNSPNDAVYRSNGDLYFTDPPFGLPGTFTDPTRELAFSGVHRVSASAEHTLIIEDLKGPNGLAFSPDESRLYVSNADADRPVWMAYDLRADGSVGPGRVFFDAQRWTKNRKGFPDGMKVDRAGNLFAAGPGGVYVFAPDGTHLGTLLLGVATSNCAFGGDGSVLYVTASTAVYRIRLRTRGAAF